MVKQGTSVRHSIGHGSPALPVPSDLASISTSLVLKVIPLNSHDPRVYSLSSWFE